MAEKRKGRKYARRDFLKEVAAGGAVASTLGAPSFAGQSNKTSAASAGGVAGGSAAEKSSSQPHAPIDFPRTFTGRNLKMIAFPLGGIGTGTVSLGGRGELRDWEIGNKPAKKYSTVTTGNDAPFFSIFVNQSSTSTKITKALIGPVHPTEYLHYEGRACNHHGLPRFRQVNLMLLIH